MPCSIRWILSCPAGPLLCSYLSQSERFQRKWSGLYAAVEDGQIDSEALRQLLISQLPKKGICVFPLDSSSWARPRSRVLADLQYVYQASSDIDGSNVTIGYAYSLLEWCAEAHTSWSLPLDVRRIASVQTAQEVGAAQIRALAEAVQTARRRWILSRRMAMDAFCPA